MYDYLNGTNYDSSQPWGENWSDWSSAGWGNGWAGTPGGVARQLGLTGREMAAFARAVNNQKRRLAELASGYSYGYKPELEVPAWIRNLYQSAGMDTGGRMPTGKSGTGKYVNTGALKIGTGNKNYGSGKTAAGKARAQGLTGREAAKYAKSLNNQRRMALLM